MTEVPFPRTVKPRDPSAPDFLPIIAADEQAALMERTGEVREIADLIANLRNEPPSLFVVSNMSWLLLAMHQEYEQNPSWQYRVTPVRREYHSFNGKVRGRRVRTNDTVVNYFGFRPQKKKKGHWHYALDPVVFARVRSGDLLEGDAPYLLRLLTWGQDVRAWCQAQELRITPTAGGLAGQLLRDPRFYPEARRKVPKATNSRARHALPGNHYQLMVRENSTHDALYLDMTSAHHNAAAEIAFPSANGLLARGAFKTTDPTDTTVPESDPWLTHKDPAYPAVMRSHGLLCLRLAVPKIAETRFPPPWAATPGRRLAWIYSNELPLLDELGIVVEGVEAAWTSFATDPGLNRYAAFALGEIATMNERRKRWAKPTLLSTYGILAAKPKVQEFAYLRAEHGIRKKYPAGHGFLPVLVNASHHELEPQTANVIHRGMIEAETRKRCLDLARFLTGQGCTVLAIYADAVFVKASDQLPLLPPPWSVKSTCTRLTFFNSTSFHSAEMTRLPGIPREGLERVRRLESIRRIR